METHTLQALFGAQASRLAAESPPRSDERRALYAYFAFNSDTHPDVWPLCIIARNYHRFMETGEVS